MNMKTSKNYKAFIAGTKKDWLKICIDEYIDYFELDYDSVKEYFDYLLKG